jgi:hypothetical protein
MSIFKDIAKFITKTLPHAIADFFTCAKNEGNKIAMAITQGVKKALESGVVEDVAKILEAVFPNVKNLPTEIVDQLKVWVPKVLAAELAIDALPADAAEEQIQKFTADVLAALGAKDDHSKTWSTLSGTIYSILRAYTGQSKMTWYELLQKVEEAFQEYKNTQADDATAETE